MDIKYLNNVLRDDAIGKGLCLKWQREWRNNWSKDELIRRYKDGIDFCISNNYPSNDFIEHHFEKNFLRENDILVNDRYSLLNPNIAVILGQSESTIRYNGESLGNIYVKDLAKITISAKTRAFVLIHAFDNCEISANAEDISKIVILKHSENVIVQDCKGNTIVKDELGYLKN